MHRHKIMSAVLIVLSVLILIGLVLMGWMYASKGKNEGLLEVKLEGGGTKALAFESLSLLPGESCEYTILLKKVSTSKYDLELDFIETEEKTLKNYAYVKLIAGDTVLCDELLATAFENDSITLPVDFDAGKNTEIRVVYYLPAEVGNEAKNAEAIFELRLTAKVESNNE